MSDATHLATTPFRAACGADERGQRTTDIILKVDCASCLRVEIERQYTRLRIALKALNDIDYSHGGCAPVCSCPNAVAQRALREIGYV
jgi:hypothetical protein